MVAHDVIGSAACDAASRRVEEWQAQAIDDGDKLRLVGNVIPASVMKAHQVIVKAGNWKSFREAVAGTKTKTQNEVFNETLAPVMKLEPGMKPSEYLAKLRISLAMVPECTSG